MTKEEILAILSEVIKAWDQHALEKRNEARDLLDDYKLNRYVEAYITAAVFKDCMTEIIMRIPEIKKTR